MECMGYVLAAVLAESYADFGAPPIHPPREGKKQHEKFFACSVLVVLV